MLAFTSGHQSFRHNTSGLTLIHVPFSINAERPLRSRPDDWGPFIFHAAWILIALLTLFPYQILPAETMLNRREPFLRWFFEKYPSRGDIFANMLLFAPFGFGLGWRLEKWKFPWPAALTLTCIASAAFSFCIELAQGFMPSRTSSWFDVLANTAGGPLGWIVFRMAGERIRALLSSCLEFFDAIIRMFGAKLLVAFFVVFSLLAIAVSITLVQWTMLNDWDVSFPLLVGNIPNGEYPWHGQLFEFAIADRAVKATEANRVFQDGLVSVAGSNIVASYRRAGPGDPSDESGHTPALHWTPQGTTDTALKPGLLPGLGWMQSQGPAKVLESRIRDANQFSVYVFFAAIRP